MGKIGLTDIQEAKLNDLETKTKALTANQAVELERLRQKKLFPELTTTAKSYCDEWIKEKLYNRKKNIESKYFDKGNTVEDDSIRFIGKQLGYSDFELETGAFVKNEQFFEDEFMCGTPDVIVPTLIVDAKNPWDFSTFPLLDEVPPNEDYFDQAQGYMNLVGRDNYKLIYTLMDTPESLIEAEMRRYAYKNGLEMEDIDYETFRENMTYDDIPDELKIKIFDIKKDEEYIKSIKERVVMCRKYIAKRLLLLPPKIKALHGIEG